MSERSLETKGLCAGYGSQPVVSDVDIIVEPGKIAALFGANGAGKTTTLMAISGVLPLLGGSVTISGRTPPRYLYQRARQGLSFVTEERSVFKGLSVADNLRLAGVNVDDVLELFPELEKRLTIRAGLISGGEQQMLSLARAVARNPRLLLADELSLGLAPLVVTRLFKALRQSAANTGAGVLLVEQHVRKALDYVDHVYVMRRGRIEMDLAIEEARERLSDIENTYLAA